MRKDVSICRTLGAVYFPANDHVAVLLIRTSQVVQNTENGGKKAVVRGVVAIVYVQEESSVRYKEACAMTHHFDPAAVWRDVPENVPQARDHIESFVALGQIFSPDSPTLNVSGPFAAHLRAWLEELEIVDGSGACNS